MRHRARVTSQRWDPDLFGRSRAWFADCPGCSRYVSDNWQDALAEAITHGIPDWQERKAAKSREMGHIGYLFNETEAPWTR